MVVEPCENNMSFLREVNLVESVLCCMKKKPSPATVDIKSTDQRGQQQSKENKNLKINVQLQNVVDVKQIEKES